MKMIGHKTEAIYRRYAIVDQAMLVEAGEKIGRFQTDTSTTALGPLSAPVVPIRPDPRSISP